MIVNLINVPPEPEFFCNRCNKKVFNLNKHKCRIEGYNEQEERTVKL